MGSKVILKLLIIVLFFGLSNCNNNVDYQYNNYMYFYKDVFHKKLIFNNSNLIFVKDFDKKAITGFKVIILINTECVSCFKEMEAWDSFIKTNNIIQKLQILFIAAGSTNEYFKYVVMEHDYSFGILLDSLNLFVTENNLEEYEFETFLLNNNDSIMLVGTPIGNDEVFGLYKYIVSKRN